MPDQRTLREKLEAMAAQTASPHEAERAREALRRLTPGASLRAFIQAQPSVKVGPGVRVREPDGQWVHYDEADVPWRVVDYYGLRYRVDGEELIRYGQSREAQPADNYKTPESAS